MGAELRCTASFGGKTSDGKALLETNEILFRGGALRLAISLARVKAVAARDGELLVTLPEGVARFALGPAAEKWADKIRNPKSLIDKLGVKPDARVAVVGVGDAPFLAQLGARARDVTTGRPKASTDFVFFLAETPRDLARLATLKRALKPNGAIWVVSPKGRPEIKDVVVIGAAKAAGLVAVKVAAFSATHTALKLVVPVAKRRPA